MLARQNDWGFNLWSLIKSRKFLGRVEGVENARTKNHGLPLEQGMGRRAVAKQQAVLRPAKKSLPKN